MSAADILVEVVPPKEPGRGSVGIVADVAFQRVDSLAPVHKGTVGYGRHWAAPRAPESFGQAVYTWLELLAMPGGVRVVWLVDLDADALTGGRS